MKMKWTLPLLATACALTLAASSLLFAAKGGKKPGGSEDPPVSDLPVLYQASFIEMPYGGTGIGFYDCNNHGQAVGYMQVGDLFEQRAFLYDPAVDPEVAIDLNDIVAGIPEGWVIRRATAINTTGDIAVYIRDRNNPDVANRAGMIDMSVTPPQLHLIDENLLLENIVDYLGEYGVASDMNDAGDIVVSYHRLDGSIGVFVYNFGLYDPLLETLVPIDLGITGNQNNYLGYRINNPTDERGAQIVGVVNSFPGDCFIHTIGEGAAVLEPYVSTLGYRYNWFVMGDINDSGQVFGNLWAIDDISKKHKDQPKWLSAIWDGSYATSGRADGHHPAFNESADFTSRYHLCHQTHGDVDVLSLLDPADVNSSLASAAVNGGFDAMTDRDNTDFPVLFSAGVYEFDGVRVPKLAVYYPVLKP